MFGIIGLIAESVYFLHPVNGGFHGGNVMYGEDEFVVDLFELYNRMIEL